MMIPVSFRWHDLLPLRDVIDCKTSGINSSYSLVFGGSPVRLGWQPCSTGYVEFDRRRCWVNAEAVPDAAPAEQFIATVYLAAHERAHARWTDYVAGDFDLLDAGGARVMDRSGAVKMDRTLHQTWNILEDERIERLVGRDFPHLHSYLEHGNRLMLALAPGPGDGDDPMEVLAWVLRRRFADRACVPEPCPLGPANLELLMQVEPLVQEAFGCSSARRVVELAREINRILALDSDGEGEGSPLLSGQGGRRGRGDHAETDGATADEGAIYSRKGKREFYAEVGGIIESSGYRQDTRIGGRVSPAPYEHLLASVRPLVAPVANLFRRLPARKQVVFEESGGRLSLRAARRTPATPFRRESTPLQSGQVALSMVVDDSGSMAGALEWHAKLTAMVCWEALQGHNRVRVVLAPSGRLVADASLGEMSRARIAGYDSSHGTEYHRVVAAELKALVSLGRAHARYLVVVGDGESDRDDLLQCRRLVRRARQGGIHTFGIGLELNASERRFFEGIFGSSYIELEDASDLPARMQGLLRRMAPSAR
jgi:hypothetical protein